MTPFFCREPWAVHLNFFPRNFVSDIERPEGKTFALEGSGGIDLTRVVLLLEDAVLGGRIHLYDNRRHVPVLVRGIHDVAIYPEEIRLGNVQVRADRLNLPFVNKYMSFTFSRTAVPTHQTFKADSSSGFNHVR